MLDEHQERRIAQGLREGKTEAWQALYDAHAEQVWRSVARLLGPECAEVADVVQETMLAAARSAATFDPKRGTLWMWVSGIARNQAILHLRKQDRRQRLVKASGLLAATNGQFLRWLEGKEPSPPGALAAAEVAMLVRATLAALPADYGVLLTARYLDDESVAEIALREQGSEVAVRSRLARARQAFREAFARDADLTPQRPEEAHHEPPRRDS
jgi:RNA polymerase sigma-70 factor (ECF subfamily)